MPQYLLSIEQGTTNSRAHVFSAQGELVGTYQLTLVQRYPNIGWVEQDPEEMWLNTIECCRQVLNQSELSVS